MQACPLVGFPVNLKCPLPLSRLAMTFEIALVLTILLVALVLFVTEWIPMDVTALLVLGTLAVTGLVDTGQAFSGFSNPAVITVWAMFILSEGLTRTGVANQIGQWVLKMAGTGEVRLIVVVMLTAGRYVRHHEQYWGGGPDAAGGDPYRPANGLCPVATVDAAGLWDACWAV